MADPRRVRVVTARVLALVGLAVALVGMVWVGDSAGADRTGLIPLVVGTLVFLLALPFCGLNRPRPR